MDALHARYPFLTAAREAVVSADMDLASLVADGENRVIERAVARVESAIESGTVGSPHRSPRVELLSYPLARVLVSLVDDAGLIRRYAHAEAETAAERFRADLSGEAELKSVDRKPLTLDQLLDEFGLVDAVDQLTRGYAVDVATYLTLVDGLSEDRWRLVSRELSAGIVPVTEEELYELLRVAIYDRVADGLPLSVPEPISAPLEPSVDALRSRLADHGVRWEFDAVEPSYFPPCIEALIDRLASGGELAAHSRFVLTSFLATVGMPAETIIDRLTAHPSIDRESAAALLDHVSDDGDVEYSPPSCVTMVAYGDCVNQDALCARIGHPLSYYERRIDGVDPDALEA